MLSDYPTEIRHNSPINIGAKESLAELTSNILSATCVLL